MNLLDNIVEIKFTKSSASLVPTSFNSLLIIGNSEGKTRVKTYANLHEVAENFDSSTPEFAAAKLAFGQSTKLDKIIIGQVFADESFEQAYRFISESNPQFYAVIITSKDIEEQFKVAALVETENRIFGISSDDAEMLDSKNTTNILHRLKRLNARRTFVIYNSHANFGTYPEAAWFGLMLTKEAGSATWAFKALSGFPVDNISSGSIGALEEKNGNYFCSMAGQDVMFNGKMANGEHIDTITGLDWVTAELKTQIGNAIVSTEKIAFTNQGIAVIESMVRNTLSKAASRDIIDLETIEVSVPDVRTVSKSDKQARTLPDVKFEARLAGAIHKLKIQGIITI